MAEQRLGVPCSPSVPGRAAQILEEKMEGVGWAESPTGTQTPFCEGRRTQWGGCGWEGTPSGTCQLATEGSQRKASSFPVGPRFRRQG